MDSTRDLGSSTLQTVAYLRHVSLLRALRVATFAYPSNRPIASIDFASDMTIYRDRVARNFAIVSDHTFESNNETRKN